jgi:hypothetical protein
MTRRLAVGTLLLAGMIARRPAAQDAGELSVERAAAPPAAIPATPATSQADPPATQPATRPAPFADPTTLPTAEEIEPDLPRPLREYALRAQQHGGTVHVYDGQRRRMEYRFAEEGGDPHVTRLTTPAGIQILGDGPAGLSLSLAANNTADQRQVHAGVVLLESAIRAGVEQTLHWKASGGPLLLEETRSAQLIDAPELEVTLLHWKSRLHVPRSGTTVRLSGLPHRDGLVLCPGHGAGARPIYTFSNPAAKGERLRTGAHLTPGDWCAMSLRIADDRWITLALMAHPSNPPPATWFTPADDAPPSMAATLVAWGEPLPLKPGESLELSYALAAFDGRAEPAAIDKVYKHWKRLTTPKPKPRLLEP